MKGGGKLGCVSVYQSGSNKENRNFSKYLSRGRLMQDIHTGNGGSETGHREVAQRSTPAGSHFLQEGGWREKVGRWCYPSTGARVTHSVEAGTWWASQVGTGAMEEMPCEAERERRNALASSLHLGLVPPIAPNPAGSQLTWSLPWSAGKPDELITGSNPGQVAFRVPCNSDIQ